MGKRLFLLLILNIIGMLLGADFLSATDTIETKAPGFEAVQTIVEPEIVENIVETPSNVVTYVAPVRMKNYTVTVVSDSIVSSGLSYHDVYRTGKFIYAHNSSNLFGNLKFLNIGEDFTITESGVLRHYRVMDKVVYEKSANGLLNGSKAVTKEVEYNANGYDISMMTCSGTAYGNGDASHRLVIFANAV